jgi:hypothetical protein
VHRASISSEWPTGKLTCFGEIAKNDVAIQHRMREALATGDASVKTRIENALAFAKFKLP